jgi:tRNA-Thr(GGU) m(6)t(6)A37 methyltransferase TsaA
MRAGSAPFHFTSIGTMRTPFGEKFGVPRQSGMVTEAHGVLKLEPDPLFRQAVRELESFSHVWVVFIFHTEAGRPWRPTIQPPRLGGPSRVGVIASRSPHRPNPIGLSALKLERIDLDAPGGIEIHLSGVDLLDGTPVLDIKPYLPYADAVPEASDGWAQGGIPRYRVEFTDQAEAELGRIESPRFRALVTQMLEFDPRPMSQRSGLPIDAEGTQGMRFAFRVMDHDVKWEVRDRGIRVLELVRLT